MSCTWWSSRCSCLSSGLCWLCQAQNLGGGKGGRVRHRSWRSPRCLVMSPNHPTCFSGQGESLVPWVLGWLGGWWAGRASFNVWAHPPCISPGMVWEFIFCSHSLPSWGQGQPHIPVLRASHLGFKQTQWKHLSPFPFLLLILPGRCPFEWEEKKSGIPQDWITRGICCPFGNLVECRMPTEARRPPFLFMSLFGFEIKHRWVEAELNPAFMSHEGLHSAPSPNTVVLLPPVALSPIPRNCRRAERAAPKAQRAAPRPEMKRAGGRGF